MSDILIDSMACRVEAEENRVTVELRRRSISIGLSYLLLILGGLAPTVSVVVLSILGEIGLFEGWWVPLTGLPFIGLSVFYLSILRRQWGRVVVDKESKCITWHRGSEQVGRWKYEQVTTLRTGLVFLTSYRYQRSIERMLWLHFNDGRKVRIAIGFPEEQQAVRAALKRLDLPA